MYADSTKPKGGDGNLFRHLQCKLCKQMHPVEINPQGAFLYQKTLDLWKVL